jgi:hypothetical protein
LREDEARPEDRGEPASPDDRFGSVIP